LLRTDRWRHLLQFHQVMAKPAILLQKLADLLPDQTKTFRRDAMGEIRRQQRRAVVAELAPEPGQSPQGPGALNCQRQQHEHPVAFVDNHHHRLEPVSAADVAVPGSGPIVGLEDRAVGRTLEIAPNRLRSQKIVVYFQPDGDARTLSREPGPLAVR
jgi:hypothetical protein